VINENIKHARKEKGISQEEMAVKLNVVRQTVSKWERGLSVPDADTLIQIADLLDVSVSQLLGVEVPRADVHDLTDKLAQLNEELAVKSRKEKLNELANRKRGMILFLSFVSMLVALVAKNEIVSIIAFCSCTIVSLVILYRNLALLTSVTTEDFKVRTLQATTVVNIAMIVIVAVVILLEQADLISLTEDSEKVLAMGITEFFLLFAGFISPRLPFSRHTGLRLPWTVRDEGTWNVAHKVLGYISLPIAISYVVASLTISNFAAVSVAAVSLLVGVPGAISLIFFSKKMRSKL